MNNPRDMITLQNALWLNREQWSNQQTPISNWGSDPASLRVYWGWNEVPVDRKIDDPSNWDAIFIKLPAGLCPSRGDSVSCLINGAQMQVTPLLHHTR